ncbi:hypothetical protein DPMN_105365 [Dreissena polymorpha]|uniref:Uncharacterized protein n=1 Tax=Dreissena polymorpha TaxID=45954 RepID=A0A9D4HBH1_DREPO|nr:hypothetical protein DPMN_105365 [Dreissena polymorpha]
MHTAGVVDNEADSEIDTNDDTDQYLLSINQIYELIFQTLGDDYCQRPAEMSTNSTIYIPEKIFGTFDPNRLSKASSRIDTRLPIGSTVLSVFQSLESVNKNIPKRGELWKVPKDLSDPKHNERTRSYKPPVPDPTSGLDFAKLPVQDHNINKLLLNMPTSSTSVSVPYSMLEHWEVRERRSLGLTNQTDLMLATILQLVCDWSD